MIKPSSLLCFATNARNRKTIPNSINHFDKSLTSGKIIPTIPATPKTADRVQLPFLFIIL